MDLIMIWKKVNKPVTTAAAVILLLLLFVLLTGQNKVSPANPMNEKEADASMMYLTSSTLTMDESLLDGVENANINSGSNDSEQREETQLQQPEVTPEPEEQKENEDTPQQEQLEQEKTEEQEETTPPVDSLISLIQKNENLQPEQTETNPDNENSENGPEIEDSEGEPEQGSSGQHSTLNPESSPELFTTSIIDGERRTEPAYYFTITLTAKGKAQNLVSQMVTVNGITKSFSNGDHIMLQEGANSIVVTLRFRDRNYNQIDAPTKTYTVYYVPENSYFLQVQNVDTGEIYSNGMSSNVTNGELNLLVQALQGNKNTSARVRLNNSNISAGSDGIYHMNLKVGVNTIRATAGTGLNQQVVEFTVNYQPDVFTLTMESAAITEKVQEGRFGGSSYAEYTANSPQFAFRISCSSVTGLERIDSITVKTHLGTTEMVHMAGANGYIQCNLDMTEATDIKATCRDAEGGIRTFTWRIKYIRTGETPENKKPIIELDLADGQVVKNSPFIVKVHGKDYLGNALMASQLQVILNGQSIGYSGISGIAYEYQLHPQEGSNVLRVVAVDNEQYRAIKEIPFVYNSQVINVDVTLVVDANVLGLGTFIQETISVPSNKTVAQIVEERLAVYGYTVSSTGSAVGDGDSNYYLAAIAKPGIAKNWHVSEERIEELNVQGFGFVVPDDLDELREFNFSQGSGWMVTLNNYFIGGPMGTRMVTDGDVIRVRFTLDIGGDIGVDPSSGIYG